MSFACGFIGVAAFIVLAPIMQGMARRAPSRFPPVMVLAFAAVIAHLCSVVLGIWQVPQFRYWNAASIFSFGVMGYVFAFGAVYKSVSLEVLLRIAERPAREVPLLEIVQHQVPGIFLGRVKILVDSGLVEQVGSKFTTTEAGRRVSARIARLRRAFAIGDSGLYEFSDRPTRNKSQLNQ